MSSVPTIDRSFVLCSTPRCGSNLLCEGLQVSRVAGRPEEHFLPWCTGHAGTLDRAALEQVLIDGERNGVFGVKLMWGHLGPLVEALRAATGATTSDPLRVLATALPNVRYIHVSREDPVRQAVSWAKAIRTGRWFERSPGAPEVAFDGFRSRLIPGPGTDAAAKSSITAERPSGADMPLTYDAKQVRWCYQTILTDDRAWTSLFQAAGIVPHRVTYEELVARYDSTVQGVLRFLGLPEVDPGRLQFRTMLRQSDATNEEWVRRFREANRLDT